ncbi:MAG TPA: thymidine phosphorylase [Polyangia bacterium]|nr:thymidine phosphorylase [Polyangia bacterium]
MTGAPLMTPALIAKKRDGGALADGELRALIDGAVAGTVPDYQLSALLMAIVWRGLDTRELSTWTRAMIASGQTLRWDDLPGPVIDKHSTGGVGDKISLCLAPLCAAAGLYVPMMAGRALGHTGGTLDKLETIPGFRTALDPRTFGRVLKRAGFVLAGQSERLVPADRLLYALRDATATVESIPLIASSILSKKVAEGAAGLVMDVKVGSGAFLPSLDQTRALARTLIALGRALGLPVRAVLSQMDQPLGDAIGNAVEVREAIDVLKGGGPADVVDLTLRLGAEMLVLGGLARDLRDGAARIARARDSGAGLERFILGTRLQGGDPRVIDDPDRLPAARYSRVIRAPRAGFVARADAGLLGRAATLLGAGRARKEDRISPGAAIMLNAKVGARVEAGAPLCTIHFDDPARARAAAPQIAAAFHVAPRAPRVLPLIVETLR